MLSKIKKCLLSVSLLASGMFFSEKLVAQSCSPDATPPSISCPANINVNNDPATCGASVTYVAPVGTDNCSGPTTIQISGAASNTTFPVGTTANTFRVTDAAGFTKECTFTITVTDNTAPIISGCPSNITVNASTGNCSQVATWTSPTASDNCNVVSSFVSDHNSGAIFSVGTTAVNYTAIDLAGNTKVCSFNIIVVDNQNPTITCPSTISASVDAGQCTAILTYTAPVGLDNCSGQTTILSAGLSSGSPFPKGTTTNTFKVTDGSGNTAVCSFNVIVSDNILPTISCPSTISKNTDAGLCTALTTYTVATGDNCSGQTSAQTSGLPSGSNFPKGTTINSFTVTDASGNTAVCSFSVVITDAEVPVITCPTTILKNTDAGQCSAVTTYTVTGTDNCSGQIVSQVSGLTSGATFPLGTTTNMYKVTDAAGSTVTCVFTVTVSDNINPAITCPANISANAAAGICTATVSYTTPVGTDNCSGATTAQIAGSASGATYVLGATTNTFKVTDLAGNTSSCSFTVTVVDAQNPTIICPSNISLNVDAGLCTAVASYTAPIGADNCSGATTAQTAGSASGSAFAKGTTVNTFKVTDGSGNTAVCSFSVIVTDNITPTITCPSNITKNTDAGLCTAVTTFTVSSADNCSGQTVTQLAGFASGTAFPKGTTTNTFKVTDLAGNSASCTFTVVVSDNESPAITCPANITANAATGQCAAVVTFATIAGTDNCSGQTTTQIAGLASGATYNVGTTTNTFKVTDASGNTTACSFSVTVVDNQNPTITCPANLSSNVNTGLCTAIMSYTAPVGTDNCTSMPSARQLSSYPVTTQIAGLASGSAFPTGVTTNTFQVVDAAGNSAVCSFTVTITDNINPTISCPANIVINAIPGNCSGAVTYTTPVGTDNCSGATTVQTAGLSNGSFFTVGTTINTFVVTDASNHSAMCSFNVTIIDNIAPTISGCPSNITLNNTPNLCSSVATWTAPTAADNCLMGSFVSTNNSGATFPVGVTTVTYTATDNSANTAKCIFTVTVIDNQNPIITCPANITSGSDVGVCGAVVNYTAPNGTDNCAVTTTRTAGQSSGTSFPVGTTLQSFKATDASGNSATCSFNITVNDTQNPNITCPSNITVNASAGVCNAVVSYTTPTGTDNCSNNVNRQITSYPTIVQTAGNASGSSFNVGTTVNTYKATDAAGNSATCSFNVIVVDNQNPVISGCPSTITLPNVTGTCGAAATWTAPTATDNCSVSSLTPNSPSGTIFFVGVNSVVYTATDASGNTAKCTFSVIINDTEMPFISCPSNISKNTDPGQCSAVATYSIINTDNCSSHILTQPAGLASGQPFPKGTTVNTFKATDASGNSAVCSFSVIVTDNETPTITCPADITKNNDLGNCSAFVTFNSAVGVDNCSGATTTQISGLFSGSSFPVGVTNNLFQVVDAGGLTKQCILKVTVLDVTNPVISNCPANITTNVVPSTCAATATWTSPTATDNCSAVTFSNNFNSGASFSSGVNVVNYVATDNAGNTAKCSFNVTVIDNQAPTITCPANITTTTNAGLCTAVATFTVTTTDNCSGQTLTQTAGLASGAAFPKGATSNTFRVTDVAGNSATCSFSVTVTDNESPAITCPSNISKNTDANLCSAVVTYTTPVGTDNCTGTTVTRTAGSASGSAFAKGTTTTTYKVTDAAGNSATCSFTVTVTDVQIPTVVSCPANATISTAAGLCSNNYSWIAPTATDNCSGATISQTSGQTSGSSFSKGVNTITYTAIDASSNSAVCSFTVTVNDLQAPSISCPANITVANDPGLCTAVVTFATLNATDNCSGVTVAQTAGLSSSANFPTGTTVNTFVATDASGNTARCSFNVKVNETELPVIVCNANITANNDAGQCSKVVTFVAPVGTDNCAGVTTAQTAGLASGSAFPKGATTNTFVATDASGNSATCSFTVTINDNENPLIVACPSNATVNADAGNCTAVYSWTAPTATDNCVGSTIAQTTGLNSGVAFPKGTTTIAYKATDASGNSSTCSFTVTVVDNQAPVIVSCPTNANVSASLGQCSANYSWTAPTVTDNCSGATISQTAGQSSGTAFSVGVNTVTYTAVDGSNNSAVCSFTITVNDFQAPSISCPSNITVANDPGLCTAVVTFATLNATDNCAGANVNQTTGLASGTNFPTGTTVNTFIATDASGNSAVCSFNVKVNETELPVIVCNSNITANNDLGQCSKVVIFVAPVGTDNCIGVNTAQTAGLASGSAFPTGATVNTFVATDASGNTATCSFTVTISDNEKPVLSCGSDITVNNDSNVCGAMVTFTPPVGTDNCAGVNTLKTVGLTSGSLFPIGTTTQTYVSTDAVGNSSACSFNVTVVDNQKPVITLCQPNITHNSASGVCGNNAFWPTPTFTDNCSGATISQTSGLPSGSTFPTGVHPIVYTVVDASGNTAVCNFTVTIVDNEAPSLSCLSNITVANDPGFCSAVVTFAALTATDNCPNTNLAQTAGLSSGSNFPAGTTVNTFVATDASGNTTVCSFTVKVVENTIPTIACISNMTGTNDLGQCGQVVNFTTPVGSDNCSGVTTAQTSGLASGSLFPVGTTVNTFVTTDASGNTASCSFNVTITDVEGPAIACASDIVVSNDLGQCGAMVTYTTPVGTDNCSNATTVQTAGLASGVMFSIGTTTNIFKVTDAAGNSAMCSFTVTVNDNENPMIACVADTNVIGLGACGNVVNYVAPMATDNCSGVTMVQVAGLPSGAVFPVGTTQNVFVATDAAGNKDTCSFNVNVSTGPAVIASFDNTVTNDTVKFMNTSTNALGYAWDFGDGSPISSDVNPTHVYAPGTYVVCLYASNLCDTVHTCNTITVITVGIAKHAPVANVSVNAYPNPTEGIVNLEVVDTENRSYTVQVMNLIGEAVYTDTYSVVAFDKNVKAIDLTRFSAGMYVIKLTGKDGIVRMNVPIVRN